MRERMREREREEETERQRGREMMMMMMMMMMISIFPLKNGLLYSVIVLYNSSRISAAYHTSQGIATVCAPVLSRANSKHDGVIA